MTALADALATRTALAQEIHATRDAQQIVDPGDETSRPMEGWEASQDLAEHLITEGWVLGAPGSIPESMTLEATPQEQGVVSMSGETFSEVMSAAGVSILDGAGDRIEWGGREYVRRLTGPQAATRAQQVDGLLAGVEVFDAEAAGMIERLLARVQLNTPLANRLVKAIDNATPGAWEFAGKALAPDATARVVTEIVLERDSHASRGYDLAHDDQHGSAHLLHEAKAHLTHLGETPTDQHVRGEMIVAASLLVAAIETIDRGTTPTVPQPVAPYDGSAGRIPMPGEPRRM
jgi:hypothetical protein